MEQKSVSSAVAVIIILIIIVVVSMVGWAIFFKPGNDLARAKAEKALAAKTAEAPPASEAKGGPKPGMLVNDRWAEDRLPEFVQVRIKLDRFLGEYNYDQDANGVPIWQVHGVLFYTRGLDAAVDCGEETPVGMKTERGTYPFHASWRIWEDDKRRSEIGGIFTLPRPQEFNTPGGKVWIRRIAWFETVWTGKLPD